MISSYHNNPLFGMELHLHLQGRWYSSHSVDLGLTKNRNVWGEGIRHNEVYHYLFSFDINGQGDLSLRDHHPIIKSY